jgi:hypothetical protein
MKNKIIILSLFFFISCDPGYRVLIENKSNQDIYVRTNPSIESYLAFKDSYYDSIISKKINSNDDSIAVYRVKPEENIELFGHIGKQPSSNDFLYKTVKIIKGIDTIKINENNLKESIDKKIKSTFYVEIK